MRWFNDLKIVWKITITIMVPALLSLGLGLYSITRLEQVNRGFTQIETSRLPGGRVLDQLKYQISDMRFQTYRHLLSSDKKVMRDAQLRMDDLMSGIDRNRDIYGELIASENEALLHERFAGEWQGYMDEGIHIAALSSAGRKKAARKLMIEEHRETFEKMRRTLNDLADLNAAGALGASRSANRLHERTRLHILCGISFIFLLAGAVTWVLTRSINRSLKQQSWIKTGQNLLNQAMQGDQDVDLLTDNILGFLADFLGARTGAFYMADQGKRCLTLTGRYALCFGEKLPKQFAFGEGAVGQAVLDKRLLFHDEPEERAGLFRSSLVECSLPYGVIIPVIHGEEVCGVIELAALEPFPETLGEFVETVSKNIAVAVLSARSRIHERRQAGILETQQEALKEANLELTKQSRYKSEFLANMSHEIRTPMNAILGFSELLDERLVKEPELKEYVERIRSSGKNLLTLINDILDLSRIEAGRLSIEPAAMNPCALMDEVGKIFSIQTRKKGLKFLIDVAEDLPESLFLDEPRLRQVLFNLVGNAVKFTHEGEIEGSVRCSKGGDRGVVRLILEIRDTGIGIPEKELTRIFEPFRQREGQKTRQYGGTGLGLTITKRLVERMGGRLTVESSEGRGSAFRVLLPDVKVVETEPVPLLRGGTEPEPVEIELLPATVLLAEDNEANRDLVRGFLSSSRIDLIEVETGKEVLALAEKRLFDLILMDMQMPEMAGDEAARILKEDPRFRDLPIIALTAAVMEEEMEKARKHTDSCLGKPVARNALLNEMAKYLPFRKRASEGSKRASEGSKRASEGSKRASEGSKLAGEEQGTKVPLEASENWPAELSERMLEEFMPIYEEVRKTLSVKGIKVFAREIVSLGESFGSSEMVRYGRDLFDAAGGFKVEKMVTGLSFFPELVERHSPRKIHIKEPKDGKQS